MDDAQRVKALRAHGHDAHLLTDGRLVVQLRERWYRVVGGDLRSPSLLGIPRPAHDVFAGAACVICASRSGVRRFAVTVDGEELDLAPTLCVEHGESYLMGVGAVLGGISRVHLLAKQRG